MTFPHIRSFDHDNDDNAGDRLVSLTKLGSKLIVLTAVILTKDYGTVLRV